MELYSHTLTPKIKIYTLTEIIFNYFRYNLEALEHTVIIFFPENHFLKASICQVHILYQP